MRTSMLDPCFLNTFSRYTNSTSLFSRLLDILPNYEFSKAFLAKLKTEKQFRVFCDIVEKVGSLAAKHRSDKSLNIQTEIFDVTDTNAMSHGTLSINSYVNIFLI